VFAYAAIELVGTASGETQHPEKVVPRAINTVILRIAVFYVGSLVLLSLLQAGVDIADPLSGAPMSDTARVGHPELTATESAVMRHQSDRANVRWMAAELGRMVERFENRIYGTQEKREPRPQCWKRPCRGARGSVGDLYCAKCGKAYADGEDAVA
jgi:hypothetical protein